MKTIKIYVGDNPIKPLYEEKLHPISQLEKAKKDLNKSLNEYVIYTNSPYVTEYFNKYGKRKGYAIAVYYNNIQTDTVFIFTGFSKCFEHMIFDNGN